MCTNHWRSDHGRPEAEAVSWNCGCFSRQALGQRPAHSLAGEAACPLAGGTAHASCGALAGRKCLQAAGMARTSRAGQGTSSGRAGSSAFVFGARKHAGRDGAGELAAGNKTGMPACQRDISTCCNQLSKEPQRPQSAQLPAHVDGARQAGVRRGRGQLCAVPPGRALGRSRHLGGTAVGASRAELTGALCRPVLVHTLWALLQATRGRLAGLLRATQFKSRH